MFYNVPMESGVIRHNTVTEHRSLTTSSYCLSSVQRMSVLIIEQNPSFASKLRSNSIMRSLALRNPCSQMSRIMQAKTSERSRPDRSYHTPVPR